MTDYDQDPPEDPAWVDLWSPHLTTFAVWISVIAVGAWVLIQALTP